MGYFFVGLLSGIVLATAVIYGVLVYSIKKAADKPKFGN